jgi:two-component system, OmpR family, phosphate regulon response regulator OmpR
MAHILMIEDDIRLAGMVADYLRQSGYTVSHAEDGASGLGMLERAARNGGQVDLVLLDLMLPDADGLDVFRHIKALAAPVSATPVIMLTAKGDPMDRVVGLEIGAEDYVSKPFEPRELLARIRVVLRRKVGTGALVVADDSKQSDILHFGRLEIDRDARQVRLDGEEKTLTSRQYALLVNLAERAGRVLTREQLAEMVAGQAQRYDPSFDRSIDVHIGRIRAIIEDEPRKPRRIITIRTTGYVFAKVQD